MSRSDRPRRGGGAGGGPRRGDRGDRGEGKPPRGEGAPPPGARLAEVEELEVKVEKLVAGGEGLARWQGVPIFVPRAAPGDRLRVRLTDRRPDYGRGEIVEILDPGPGRREPPAPISSAVAAATSSTWATHSRSDSRPRRWSRPSPGWAGSDRRRTCG